MNELISPPHFNHCHQTPNVGFKPRSCILKFSETLYRSSVYRAEFSALVLKYIEHYDEDDSHESMVINALFRVIKRLVYRSEGFTV